MNQGARDSNDASDRQRLWHALDNIEKLLREIRDELRETPRADAIGHDFKTRVVMGPR